jgi:hypothetical protein
MEENGGGWRRRIVMAAEVLQVREGRLALALSTCSVDAPALAGGRLC